MGLLVASVKVLPFRHDLSPIQLNSPYGAIHHQSSRGEPLPVDPSRTLHAEHGSPQPSPPHYKCEWSSRSKNLFSSPAASLSSVTPYVAMNFDIIPKQLSEPFNVSTPVGGIHVHYPQTVGGPTVCSAGPWFVLANSPKTQLEIRPSVDPRPDLRSVGQVMDRGSCSWIDAPKAQLQSRLTVDQHRPLFDARSVGEGSSQLDENCDWVNFI
ncbi:hypothetical protein MTR67_023375 [Solanum verrucosum]|uniref:Uncharacterized protein n=1 Tax=Solanum verrucosum TaxID=315347 RepID=A0AAF0QWD3_SOLVR|nr:hypothetical protein MTR67_023375 [Solanum verrucosum]